MESIKPRIKKAIAHFTSSKEAENLGLESLSMQMKELQIMYCL